MSAETGTTTTWRTNTQRIKWLMVTGIAVLFLVAGLLWQEPAKLFRGLLKINVHPSLLLSDYIEIGGLGAALWNAALVMLGQLLVLRLCRIPLAGIHLAVVILVGGFSLFGTNVLNSIPIVLGAALYGKLTKKRFTDVATATYLGTALGPFGSIIAFGLGLPPALSIPLGFLTAIVIGFFVPLLAATGMRHHMGFTLYNIGYISGVIGMIGTAVLRMFGFEVNPLSILHDDHVGHFVGLLAILFASLIVFGLLLNQGKMRSYLGLLANSGRLPTDFDTLFGTGTTFFNIGVMGLLSILYVYLTKGPFNGPVLGGILSVAGFAALGKHPRNAIPVMAGVWLAAFVSPIMSPGDTSALLAALFGTTLAPIAGEYGVLAGVVSGFLHTALVGNVLGAHGGVNLYNNGFSSGFIASVMVPLFQHLRERKEKPHQAKDGEAT